MSNLLNLCLLCWSWCDVEVLLLVFFCFLWLCVCLQGQSQVCCLCVDQLSVFVQQQCCRSVLSGRALVRAGAILGSAVMMLLLLFDAVHLHALWRTGWDVGKGKPAPPPPDVAFEWYSEALWCWLVRDERLFWDTRVLAHSYFTMWTSVSVLFVHDHLTLLPHFVSSHISLFPRIGSRKALWVCLCAHLCPLLLSMFM